jgi:hypothetical protein
MNDRDRHLEPSLFLMGCQPWPPKQWDDGCPVCGSRIEDRRVYCGWCDDVSDWTAARVASERAIAEAHDFAAARDQRDRMKLAKAGKTKLTESHRRRIWNGYRRSIVAEIVGPAVTNQAKIGRDWLNAIGQAPDWALPIERRERRTA